jgi:hypothetical protein
MKKQLVFVLIGLICISIAPCTASGSELIFELTDEPFMQDFGLYNWRTGVVNGIGIVERNSLSATVEDAFRKIDYFRDHYDDFNDSTSEIVEIDVRDINGDGMYEIVGTCGAKKCELCPPAYFVITRQGDSFRVRFINAAGASLNRIKDMNGDGVVDFY